MTGDATAIARLGTAGLREVGGKVDAIEPHRRAIDLNADAEGPGYTPFADRAVMAEATVDPVPAIAAAEGRAVVADRTLEDVLGQDLISPDVGEVRCGDGVDTIANVLLDGIE